MHDITLKLTVAALDSLREKLSRALEAVEEMSRNVTEGRAELEPDTWTIEGEDIAPNATLEEAMELTEYLVPERVRGYAIVRDVWAVRVPVGNEAGDIEGDEIFTFDTQEQAQDYADTMSSEDGEEGTTNA